MTHFNKIAFAAVLLSLTGVAGAQEVVNAAGGNNAGLIAIGKGLALGLGAIGTGYAQAKIGTSIVGAVAEDPKAGGRMLLYFLLPEPLVLLGFVVLFLI